MHGGSSLLRKTDLTRWIIVLASLVGVAAFVYPFFVGVGEADLAGFEAHAIDAPLVTLLCLLAILSGMEGEGLGSKQVALLGILSAIGALLRFVPGPSGFSALFFLPILGGYVVGPVFGFLLGTLTLFISALVTSGVGPWLPYQMLCTGWVGMLAGWLPDLRRWRWGEVALLSVYSVVLGLVFGSIMNLWFWPFLGTGMDSALLWEPGLPLLETIQRYGRYYLTTSLVWDLARGIGNLVLILVLGRSVLRLLRRFTKRFAFQRQAGWTD
jgi:energy-coupling factor transport system substrate-specific component